MRTPTPEQIKTPPMEAGDVLVHMNNMHLRSHFGACWDLIMLTAAQDHDSQQTVLCLVMLGLRLLLTPMTPDHYLMAAPVLDSVKAVYHT